MQTKPDLKKLDHSLSSQTAVWRSVIDRAKMNIVEIKTILLQEKKLVYIVMEKGSEEKNSK